MVAAGEPLWLDSDRWHALALLAEEAETCSCGELRSESTSPDAEYDYEATPLRCHACAARERANREFLSDSRPSSSDGLLFAVHRKVGK